MGVLAGREREQRALLVEQQQLAADIVPRDRERVARDGAAVVLTGAVGLDGLAHAGGIDDEDAATLPVEQPQPAAAGDEPGRAERRGERALEPEDALQLADLEDGVQPVEALLHDRPQRAHALILRVDRARLLEFLEGGLEVRALLLDVRREAGGGEQVVGGREPLLEPPLGIPLEQPGHEHDGEHDERDCAHEQQREQPPAWSRGLAGHADAAQRGQRAAASGGRVSGHPRSARHGRGLLLRRALGCRVDVRARYGDIRQVDLHGRGLDLLLGDVEVGDEHGREVADLSRTQEEVGQRALRAGAQRLADRRRSGRRLGGAGEHQDLRVRDGDGEELRLDRLVATERARRRLALGRDAPHAVRAGDVDEAGADLRDRGLLLADHDAGDADGDAVLAERALVPLREVGVRLAQRPQQAAGERERLLREEVGDGGRDLGAELGGALVERLGEHEQAHGLVVADAALLREPGPLLADLAVDDREAADPDPHVPRHRGRALSVQQIARAGRLGAPPCT